MLQEIRIIAKTSLAHPALERLLARVLPFVTRQMSSFLECGAAKRALVGFFGDAVSQFVHSQVTGIVESEFAMTTSQTALVQSLDALG